jgi:hypothetical protein
MRTVQNPQEEAALEAERPPAGCGPWKRKLDELDPLPADPVEAPSTKIARLEGELAALRLRNEPPAKKKE